MRPDPARVLTGVASALLMQVTPEVRTPFGQQLASMAGLLNFILAQEADRMVDRLHNENRAVAALLEDAAPLVPDAILAARAREAAAGSEPADLRVTTLQTINDRLRRVLIEVHEAVEEGGTPECAAMDARIWSELAESTRRRHVEMLR